MQESRLFKLLYYLLDKGQTTAPELAEELEVSVRTIYRDIDALSSAGIPIYSTQGKGGGIALIAGYTLDKAVLSKSEQEIIMNALCGLSAVMPKSEKDLLLKLGGMFKQTIPDWIEVDFSHWGSIKIDSEKFITIKTAIFNKDIISFHYTNSCGKTGYRKVKPAKICYKSNAWYLQAFCIEKNNYRTFKINRMIEVGITSEHFSDKLVPPLLNSTLNDKEYPFIRLKFTKEVAYRVYDEFDSLSIKEQKNHDTIVECNFPEDAWLYGYLLSFCGCVEILEPEHIKNVFAKILKEMYIHYTSNNSK